MNFKTLIFKGILTLIFIAQTSSLFAEYIFLKSGEIIPAEIIKDGTKEIIIKDKEKKQQAIARDKIIRIVYQDLKMGAVYIQKRSGESIVAYIVDEDRETFTIRRQLYKNAEQIIKRLDVLFIAEKNPSGLQTVEKPKADSVKLTWLVPYGIVTKYNIYLKTNKAEKYVLADAAKDKTHELKNLKSNTRYYIIVTGVDEKNYESLPSNEIEIITDNIPPIMSDKINIDQMNKADADVSWEKGTDPDGQVIGYKVYLADREIKKLLAETHETRYVLKNWADFKKLKLEITAIDNKKYESLPQSINIFECENLFRLTPSLIFPIGKFAEMGSMGYGASLQFSRKNLLAENSQIGLEAGFYTLKGNYFYNNENQKFNTIQFMPLYITFGYKVLEFDAITGLAAASIGAAYVKLAYQYWDSSLVNFSSKEKSFIDPASKLGFSLEYRFRRFYAVQLNLELGAFLEQKPILFIQAGLSLGYLF